MKKYLLIILMFSIMQGAYADGNHCGVSFTGVYTRLVNRGPDRVTGYGVISNQDDVEHTVTGVSAAGVKKGEFKYYRSNGVGNFTADTTPSITLAPKNDKNAYYVWKLGGAHFLISGFEPDELPKFGTDYDANRTLDITFVIDNTCRVELKKVPICDRVQWLPCSSVDSPAS